MAQQPPLRPMFEEVSRGYDLSNRLLTFGLDKRWRTRAVRRCLALNPKRILDLCCGTGDLALRIAELSRGVVEVVGLDFTPEMLQIAQRKAERNAFGSSVRFVEGDAGATGLAGGSFDAVCVSFAMRNLTWRNPARDKVLGEVRRVLRPGGSFVVVETSQPKSRLLRTGFHAFLKMAVVPIGGLVSWNRAPYRYLAESMRHFDDAAGIGALLVANGFVDVEVEPLLGGVAAIHVAKR